MLTPIISIMSIRALLIAIITDLTRLSRE